MLNLRIKHPVLFTVTLLAVLAIGYNIARPRGIRTDPSAGYETSNAAMFPERGIEYGELPHVTEFVSPEDSSETLPSDEREYPRRVIDPESLSSEPTPPDFGGSHLTEAPLIPLEAADEQASFSVKIRDLVSPYQVLGLFVMPGERIDVEPVFSRPGETYTVSSDEGDIVRSSSEAWNWTAPKAPGAYVLLVEGPVDTIRLNVFVKTPFDNDDPKMKGYYIGSYEKKPLRQDPGFNPPDGLVEVNEESEQLRVSPHFTLGAFTCHQPGDPKFVLLDERLVLKLEMLLEEVRKYGVEAGKFTVMSGYRTPNYNKQIGNTTKYSLHLYGRAVDIFVDEDKNGQMDDLNRDGKITIADAQVLYTIAEKMDQQAWYQPFIGGLGLYGPKPHRGPFVHVDVRGYTARW